MSLISVIIPVYNVEAYLRKCIESVQNQTYRNLEILLVDDGSTDNSPSICDEYAMQDARIKVIHQKNAGLSVARNNGLNIAKGKYIFFVDSDDYLDSETFHFLQEKIEKFNADMAICEYVAVAEDGELLEESVKDPGGELIMTGRQLLLKNAIGNEKTLVIVWNKLYRRHIFENIRFQCGKQHEDEFIFHEICSCCDTVVITFKTLYFYTQRKDSIMGKEISGKNVDAIEAFIRRILYMSKLKDTEMRRACECTMNLVHYFAFVYSRKLGFDNYELNILTKRYRKEIIKLLPIVLKIPDKNINEKLQFVIWLLSPRFCGKLWGVEKYERE